LIVLPEMFATCFSINVEATTQPAREIEQFVFQLAKSRQATVVAGLAARDEQQRARNLAIVARPTGTLLTHYSKIHPFTLGGEADCYLAGDKVVTFGWQGFTVAPFVCYDLRFPEIFRHATKRGANLFVVIANWPIARAEHWVTLLRARAIENQAYVVGVNRVGRDPNLVYGGRSILVDPMGTIRADAGAEEGLLIADLDLQFLERTRRQLPFLQDLRDDFLGQGPATPTI